MKTEVLYLEKMVINSVTIWICTVLADNKESKPIGTLHFYKLHKMDIFRSFTKWMTLTMCFTTDFRNIESIKQNERENHGDSPEIQFR